MSDGTERQGSSKDRLTPEKLEEYRGLLPMGRFIGVGGDALRALLDEIQACWDERNAPETNPQASREIEVLCAERDGAVAQREWYIQLLTRFWKITPPDFKTPDGRTMQFVDPDPQRSLRIIRDAMVEAQRQIESEHAEKARVARKDCKTCLGYGMVGGFVSPDSGYQSDPCPDCSPENGGASHDGT